MNFNGGGAPRRCAEECNELITSNWAAVGEFCGSGTPPEHIELRATTDSRLMWGYMRGPMKPSFHRTRAGELGHDVIIKNGREGEREKISYPCLGRTRGVGGV